MGQTGLDPTSVRSSSGLWSWTKGRNPAFLHPAFRHSRIPASRISNLFSLSCRWFTETECRNSKVFEIPMVGLLVKFMFLFVPDFHSLWAGEWQEDQTWWSIPQTKSGHVEADGEELLLWCANRHEKFRRISLSLSLSISYSSSPSLSLSLSLSLFSLSFILSIFAFLEGFLVDDQDFSRHFRSFYVGDAVGRKYDHNDANIKFAKVRMSDEWYSVRLVFIYLIII